MPRERKYYQRRNLGSMRIDLPLKKKRQFLKKIITFKESYHKVPDVADRVPAQKSGPLALARMWGKKIPRADNGSFSKYHQLFLAPENNKEKKFQPQITTFFAKKK